MYKLSGLSVKVLPEAFTRCALVREMYIWTVPFIKGTVKLSGLTLTCTAVFPLASYESLCSQEEQTENEESR